MVMWGVGEDEMKGGHGLLTTLIPGMSLKITTKNLHGKNGNMQRKLHQKAIC